jgi:hypothetical protein
MCEQLNLCQGILGTAMFAPDCLHSGLLLQCPCLPPSLTLGLSLAVIVCSVDSCSSMHVFSCPLLGPCLSQGAAAGGIT